MEMGLFCHASPGCTSHTTFSTCYPPPSTHTPLFLSPHPPTSSPPTLPITGDPVEGFKLLSLKKGSAGVDGQDYYLADIAYTLNTGAHPIPRPEPTPLAPEPQHPHLHLPPSHFSVWSPYYLYMTPITPPPHHPTTPPPEAGFPPSSYPFYDPHITLL